jgi:hypothetical protein
MSSQFLDTIFRQHHIEGKVVPADKATSVAIALNQAGYPRIGVTDVSGKTAEEIAKKMSQKKS